MSFNLISVVIAVYNSQQTIAEVIQSVLSQDYSYPMEVVIVDDGSTDKTADIVHNYPDVKYFYQSNQGPAAARNAGAQEAAGEIVFFMDSDCVARKDWITKNIKHFRDPSVAVVAGSYDILNPQSLLSRVIHSEIVFRHKILMPRYPKVFGSYNFSIRKKIFWEVGGFNTEYRYPSGEDNDLSYKVIRSGYGIYFALDSLVGHYHTDILWKYLKEQYRHGFWRVKMYSDHPKMSQGDGYTFWKDVIEIPLSLLIILSLMLLVYKPFVSLVSVLFLVGLLTAIELFYAFKIAQSSQEKFFLSCVMCLRSFARSFGFSSGIFYFFLPKFLKKSK